jgi:hypothetical protein
VECLKLEEPKIKVYITMSALLTLQLHAHILTSEIIGFLGGYNIKFERKKQQTIIVTEAYPGEAEPIGKRYRETNVEITPESQ